MADDTVARSPEKVDLASLEKELKLALEQHVDASRQESVARNAVCDATNRVNRAQKALVFADALLKELDK